MPSTDTSGPTTTTGEQSQRQTDRGEVPANMYIITCGNENEIVMEPETGYVPNNPLFGLPQSQLDKVSNRPTNAILVHAKCPGLSSDRVYWSANIQQPRTEQSRINSVH